MFPRFLSLGVGALALLVVLGAPGQVHAQRGRGGHPGFHGPVMSGSRGGFFPGMGMNHGFFQPGFNSGFNRNSFTPRFNSGFNRNFDLRFDPRFNGGLPDPRINTGFRPSIIRLF
jgi:hypothetical protein